MSYKKTDRIVYTGRKIRVHECEMVFPGNKQAIYEYASFDTVTGVSILPVTDTGIKLIRYYQLGLDQETWCLPTGGLTAGEDPAKRAMAELQEETGLAAKELQLMLRFHAIPGYVGGESGYIYVAKDLYASPKTGDEPFPIEIKDFTWAEALDLIKSHAIIEGRTIAAVLYYLQFVKMASCKK